MQSEFAVRRTGRVVYIRLTKKGEKAYRHHEEFHTQMTQAVVDKLTEEEIPVLLKTLNGLFRVFPELS